jgi:ribosomal protein L37AE/L43A
MNSLDRVLDGIPRPCSECLRLFKGDSWQDYCVECHAKAEADSPLNKIWACTTCNSTFPVGTVKVSGSAPANAPWPCPRCDSPTITPADGATRETAEYYGELPPMHQRS